MLAIIPARGGSKGLPGKNIKPFNGKPLIAHTIEVAKKSKYIKQIIVSTDDSDISCVAKEYGAEVPFLRPAELAKDDSPAIETYFYTMKYLEEQGKQVENFIVLQPTSPLRQVAHIDSAIELFYEKNADSIISVCQNRHPLEWAKKINKENKLISVFEDNNKNRQEYKKTYYPNGMIFIFKYAALKESKDYYMKNTYPIIIDHIYSVDIDDINDFEYAEYLHKRLYT